MNYAAFILPGVAAVWLLLLYHAMKHPDECRACKALMRVLEKAGMLEPTHDHTHEETDGLH